jgi:hypothetical protein
MPLPFRKITAFAAAALALAALPQTALAAGQNTANGNAALQVTNLCTLSGTSIDLGTYSTNQTWGDVGASLGLANEAVDTSYRVGTRGTQYLELGTVSCPATVLSAFNVLGTGAVQNTPGTVPIAMNGKVMNILLFVKKFGTTDINDFPGGFYAGAGEAMVTNFFALSTSDGSPQKVLGSALVFTRSSTAALTDKLTAGTYSSQLSYTLNF